MKKKIVEGGDGVEQDGFVLRAQQLNERRNASALEDGEEALAVVAQVVQRARRATRRLRVVRIVHSTDERSHHLATEKRERKTNENCNENR